jgi:predicted enzyme related to lactoylglutathione lyase
MTQTPPPHVWPTFSARDARALITFLVDALFARVVKNGAAVVAELHDTDYGSRDFAVHDPEGNHWSFGTYRGHPR